MQTICLVIFLFVELAFGISDFDALLEFKKGIKRDPFGIVLDSWNAKSLASNRCPKDWHGVGCTDGNVESIVLNDVGLVGEIDFKIIVSLKMLRNLSISNNQLSGTILDIAYIESLEHLDLSCNLFHGTIPSNFTALKNLVVLNLSTNNFEGLIPLGFHNLKKLEYLDLHSNRFYGDVMKLISELGGVVVVDLSFNQISGYLDIGLGSSSFVSNIKYLNVSHNALVGELFFHDGVPYFDNLEVFDASYNQLNGTIPPFNFVVSLRVLLLGHNQLSGALPEALLDDSSMILSELDLSSNQLEGPVGSITSTSLRSLNLSSNQLSGSLPLRIGHCSILDLSNNRFSGNVSRLQYWGNYVEIIQLSSNSLTGTFPNETSQFLRLTSFRVSNNSLQGVLPHILFTYPELEILDVSFNHISGFLVPSLFNSTKLTDLNLPGNNFSGNVPLQFAPDPKYLGSLYNFSLFSLNLSHNLLTGEIPVGISNFHSLLYLDLSNNNFEGTIPSNLSDQLISLNVSYNNLSGIVPENLRRFPDASFHPGNSLLTFPLSPSSPESISSMASARHHRMKRAVLAFILTGLIATIVVLVFLFTVIYNRIHKDQSREDLVGSKDYRSGTSSLPSTSPSHKSMDPSSTMQSSGLGILNSSKMAASPEVGNSSLMVTKCKDLSSPELVGKDSEISSVSALSSTNPSPSKGKNLLGHFSPVKFGSPDKLSGDLHLFDGSLLFTAEQLSRAPAEVIGKSCHGTLYRAALDSGHILVVKRLKVGISKAKKEFCREAKKLGNVRHPNLVSLQGYCWGPREHEKLIISSYFNAPCLGIYLQGSEQTQVPPLSLEKRLKAATEVAQCLDYLHNEKAMPHGNLKSTNILIHPSEARILVTDYSLHRIMTPAGTADQVINASALGYSPPEFINSSKPCPSIKSDVYAFGVILLELLTGRSSAEIVSANQGAVDLTDWVKMLVAENRARDCFDKGGFGLGSHLTDNAYKALDRMLEVALRCILPASERPDMRTIFDDLSSIKL